MASGSEQKKAALVAEAKALRSYAHFLLVNKFAKAYDPATASTDGGVIYMTEDKSIDEIYAPSTVAKVYEQCLRDVNDAINSGALPAVQPTKTRFNLPAAYALKANILMCSTPRQPRQPRQPSRSRADWTTTMPMYVRSLVGWSIST